MSEDNNENSKANQSTRALGVTIADEVEHAMKRLTIRPVSA